MGKEKSRFCNSLLLFSPAIRFRSSGEDTHPAGLVGVILAVGRLYPLLGVAFPHAFVLAML